MRSGRKCVILLSTGDTSSIFVHLRASLYLYFISSSTDLRAFSIAPDGHDTAQPEQKVYQRSLVAQVHCDPHPGNVLVRARVDDPSQPCLVLLDHGLYRELPRRFTLLYAELWHSIVLGDADGIRRVSFELGVGE